MAKMEQSLATVPSKDFKELVKAVSRFPSIGAFAGSEMIMLSTSKNVLLASSYGVVLSKASTPIEGDLPLLAVDERVLIQFATTCGDDGTVTITTDGKIVLFKHKKKEVKVPFTSGQVHEFPVVDKAKGLHLSSTLAKKINYLSMLAHSDSSRLELCCVMLSQNRAISCSPKVFANLGTDYTSTENAPIPLPLAKELREGDTLIPGKSHTVLVSGVGQHCMPALVKARESFPLAVVEKYNAAIKSEICMVSLNRLNKLVGDCDTILSAIAKTEVVLCFSYAKGRLSLKATNSSTEFTGSVPTQADWVGKDSS